MKNIIFGELGFTVMDDGILTMTSCYGIGSERYLDTPRELAVCELDVAGGATSGTHRMSYSEQTAALRYVSHSVDGDVLTIVQNSPVFEVISRYERYADTNAVRITQEIRNVSTETVCLEMANTAAIHFGDELTEDSRAYYLHKFNNARYTEAMPDVRSLYDLGLQWTNYVFHVENYGNASACEQLPQGILENRRDHSFLMFQIESYFDWFYQISASENTKRFELQIGGPSALYHAWNKYLKPGESYCTVPVALAGGHTLNGTLAEMTRYRRHIKPDRAADAKAPAIYNEYMHFSWDDPNAARVIETAPFVKEVGCEYYVVDCGWHDSKEITDTAGMYPKFGTWYEDRTRFPDGIRAVAEYVRSLGMHFGLWIAPEVVGIENKKMLEYYDDSCFFVRNGKRIRNGTGYLLDYRSPKVRDYMSRTLDRMIDEYGCDYIKFDGCPNPGFGTELDSTSPGDGLEKHTEAFLSWAREAMERHPNVIFEDCAGGGQRMDYKALSLFDLISTSDQTDYLHYPYISANISASVLPEQAAVWSYPVASDVYDPQNESASDGLVSKERVAVNMINSLLGRIHLASRIYLLSEEKREMIREGVELYYKMAEDKSRSVPYLPLGYASFGDTVLASGLRTDEKVYLAVWRLNGDQSEVNIPLTELSVKDVSVAYPLSLPTSYSYSDGVLSVRFTEKVQARLFTITLE